ncbi:S41 family peptidase [Rufibacter sp. DG15C]|uniref:S41 family peptidase n=1 Tax=Rufibacter sp. DG15C TaxID=1379909 RepID=UPI0009E95AC8|nr:S41 family peptidase [Rufibacter sp. DG15C]
MIHAYPTKMSASFSLKPLRVLFLLLLGFCLVGVHKTQAQDSLEVDTEKHLNFYRIWGFVKYYHPASAEGRLKADSLFFLYLPKVDSAKTEKQANAVFKAMLQSIGLPEGEKIKPQEDNPKGAFLLKNVEDSWRHKSKYLNNDIRKHLEKLFERRYTGGKHHYTYVRYNPYGGTVPHELEYVRKPHENLSYPLRMLALAKFKTYVDYLYPYKYLMDVPWDDVILQAIPLFAKCDSRQEYERLLLTVNARLDDTQAFSFFRQLHHREKLFKNHYFPPFDYRIAEKKIIVTAIIDPVLCRQSNIKRGDVIEALDSVAIEEWVSALKSVLAVSNNQALWARVGEWGDNLLFRSEDDKMQVRLTRGEEQVSTTLRLMNPSTPAKAKLIDIFFKKEHTTTAKKSKNLAYAAKGIVHFKIDDTYRFINDETPEEDAVLMDSLLNKASRAKGIIFDMRGEPDNSDFVYQYLYKKFGKKNHYFARYYQLNPYQLGTYRLLTQPEVYFPATLTPEEAVYNGKVIILVNGRTHSIGEWNIMSLQRLFPNSITLGEQTAGADGDVKKFPLPGGYEATFSGNAIYYPNNTATQRQGIKLNVPAQPTLKGVLANKDELLQKAIALIKGEEQAAETEE